MSGLRPDADRHEYAERTKIMVGRAPGQGGRKIGPLWWRLTVYVGDTREDIDAAVAEALRVDERLRGLE